MSQQLDEQFIAHAKRAQENLTIENGIIKSINADFDFLDVEGSLPEDTTKAQYTATQKQRNINSAVLEYAIGDLANQAFKENPDLTSVTATIQVGNEKWSGTSNRERQVDRATPEEKKNGVTKVETVYGAVTGSYSSKSTAQHKRVRTHISGLAKELFGTSK